MISTNDCETRSSASAANTATKWSLAALLALGILILTPVAHAECPPGGACYTAREAQACLVCLKESEALRKVSREKESQRNAAIAAQNVVQGALGECRIQSRALDIERMEWARAAQAAERRPTWWVVVGVGVSALVVGGVVGAIGFSQN